MNTYKRTLLQDLDKIFKENNIVENSHYCICVKEFIKELPDNELIKGVIAKWYNRSKSIELRFDINNLKLFKVDVKYRISENSISWFIQYYIKRYNEIDNENKSFVEHLNICLDCIRTEGEYWEKRKGKLTSKDEFSEELISKLQHHLSSSKFDKNYKPEKMVLGINRNSFRPMIGREKSLENCDIYNLEEYVEKLLDYFRFQTDNCHQFWEPPIFVDLAEKYIKKDIVESRKSQSEGAIKITKNEFRKAFYHIMYLYLEEKNRLSYCTSGFKSDLDREKFLGICPHTLRPFIGVIEGLDGCDVYKIDEFEISFKIGEDGKYVSTNNRKFILENKKILEALEAKYFEDKTVNQLPLVRKAEEHTIDEDSEFICLYYTRYNPISMYSTIMGKYGSYIDMPFNKWVYISKPIYNYMKNLFQEKINRNHKLKLASEYYNEAKKHKKQKDFYKAIEYYRKCEELNVGYVAYKELITCYRALKDFENERRIAIEAYERFPEIIEFKKAYLSATNQMPSEKLSSGLSLNLVIEDYGSNYEREIQLLPEYTFNIKDNPFYKLFYEELGERTTAKEEKRYKEFVHNIKEIQSYFKDKIKRGKNCEYLGEINQAVLLYEELIAEHCYIQTPYERLIVIYSKWKRQEDLVRVLNYSIDFFKSLEQRQYEYVMYLADKYCQKEKLERLLHINKPIKYWFGDIVLYQKYPTKKWEQRLSKLLNNNM